MDVTPFYRKAQNGQCLLHFPNYYGYTEQKVREIFAKYGKLAGVDLRGGTHGMCFVRYFEEKDAIASIINLKGHNRIKILKHKHKPQNGPKKQNTSKQNLLPEQKSSDTPHKKIEIPSLLNLDTKAFQLRSNSRANSVIEDSVSVADMSKMKMGSVLSENSCSLPMTSSMSDKCFQVDFKGDEVTKIELGHVAEDVIVANIQASYGIHSILQMLEKFGPICITLMKTIPQVNIRYCIVYFRTLQAAQSVQDTFDNFILGGRKLIVLRPKSLITEVKLA